MWPNGHARPILFLLRQTEDAQNRQLQAVSRVTWPSSSKFRNNARLIPTARTSFTSWSSLSSVLRAAPSNLITKRRPIIRHICIRIKYPGPKNNQHLVNNIVEYTCLDDTSVFALHRPRGRKSGTSRDKRTIPEPIFRGDSTKYTNCDPRPTWMFLQT